MRSRSLRSLMLMLIALNATRAVYASPQINVSDHFGRDVVDAVESKGKAAADRSPDESKKSTDQALPKYRSGHSTDVAVAAEAAHPRELHGRTSSIPDIGPPVKTTNTAEKVRTAEVRELPAHPSTGVVVAPSDQAIKEKEVKSPLVWSFDRPHSKDK